MTKKARNKRGNRKPSRPREEVVYFLTAPNTRRIELFFDPVAGRIAPGMDCVSAHTEISYARENPSKPRKVVARVFGAEPHMEIAAAVEDFSFLVAIDTNSVEVEGRTRSVTGIAISDNRAYGVPYCIETAELPPEKRERIGWHLAIQELLSDGLLRECDRTLVLVDAHLSELSAISNRSQEIIPGHLLPEAWSMGYASADTGGDFRGNALLQLADKSATQVMRKLSETATPMLEGPHGGALHGPLRKVSGKNSFTSWEALYASVTP